MSRNITPSCDDNIGKMDGHPEEMNGRQFFQVLSCQETGQVGHPVQTAFTVKTLLC